MKNDLIEARERLAKAEEEKEDLKRKTEELERKLVEARKEREEGETKAKEGKASETKKLLSSVTKLLLASFPTDQVCAFDFILWLKLSLDSSRFWVQEFSGQRVQENIKVDNIPY